MVVTIQTPIEYNSYEFKKVYELIKLNYFNFSFHPYNVYVHDFESDKKTQCKLHILLLHYD